MAIYLISSVLIMYFHAIACGLQRRPFASKAAEGRHVGSRHTKNATECDLLYDELFDFFLGLVAHKQRTLTLVRL